MKTMLRFGLSKTRRTESSKPLLESNNNDIQDGHDQAGNWSDNPLNQNASNTHEEQRSQSAEEISDQELAELLRVAPEPNTSEDGFCRSMRPEPKSGQQSAVRLIERSVSQHFPKPPADLDQSLQQHLLNVQQTVHNEVVRLGPLLQSTGFMGYLIDGYHRQTFDHLHDLLHNISSSKNSFLLMKWVLHTYLSQELLGHPDLQQMDLIKEVDLLLLTQWVAKAEKKLLENVQTEVRGFLERILQSERNHERCDSEEDYVRFYVDTIGCIDAMPTEAQKISSKLSDLVQEVCFQELLMFLERYTAEQTEILGKQAKMDKPETIHFLKTLNTCKELKQHVQTKGKSIDRSLLQKTVATLENMESFTMKLLKEIVADIAESHLSSYFKTSNKQFFFLILAIKAHFPKPLYFQDLQKRVMDEAYMVIDQIYLKHLVQSSQKKLKKIWGPNVGQQLTEDAELLHNTISELAPGVQHSNIMLQKITELLECTSTDATKMTVAHMQKECLTWREDLVLLSTLLRWKGLSGREVREVLDALPGQPPRSVSWYSCLPCW